MTVTAWMLAGAPAYQLSARDQIAPAYQLSALDHSQVIGYILFLSERLSETLFILRTSGPLQRLSSAARLRKATEESQNILR